MSTKPPTTIAVSNPRTPSYQNAVYRTRTAIENALRGDRDTLIQPPPIVPVVSQLAAIFKDLNEPVTYLTNSRQRRKQLVDACKKEGLTALEVISDEDLCESFNGGFGTEYANKVQKVRSEQDCSIGELHESHHLKCQPGCAYRKADTGNSHVDVLVGHPVVAHMDAVRVDRSILAHDLTGDEYVTTIENPARQLRAYLESETDLDGYVDFVKSRTTASEGLSIYDYIDGHLDATVIDSDRALNEDGHVRTPLAVFGLQFTETLSNGWETTHSNRSVHGSSSVPVSRYESEGHLDRWGVNDLDFHRNRVVREPGETIEDDKLHILQLPDFSTAKRVVGLDTAPSPWMWNACYGVKFTHKEVFSTAETRSFLQQTMGHSRSDNREASTIRR